MIPSHLKPSMVFTPAKPRERRVPHEEGVPLHAIDRRLLPGMRVVWHDGRAKPQAALAAERDEAGEQGSGGAEVTPLVAQVQDHVLIFSSSPPPPCSPSPPPPNSFAPPPPQNRGGRPRAITPQRRVQLLHILRRGQSRRHAATRMGIDAASITRAVRRDPRLGIEVMEAEEEGQMFLEIWDRLYSLQETTLELKPVVSTPQLEREKEYLISCGLPAAYVRRLRQRTSDDPPPPPIPPEFKQANRELKTSPWKKGWRRKKAKTEADWW